MEEIWSEKYRPKTFEEMQGQEGVVARVKALVQKKNVPHLMLAGPAGVGKTSLVLVIVQALYGEQWRENFLELNASDDRGIDIVRTKIKDFARTMAIGEVPFKVILLDECDSLTSEAQQALRRTMETYSSNCRFFLSCNYSSKIIDPIQSRCSILRFQQLDKQALEKLVERIVKREGLRLKQGAFDALYVAAGGDARRAVNILQSCAALDKSITAEAIFQLSGSAQPREIQEILQLAAGGSFIKARNLLLDVMLKRGLSGLDMVKHLQREILQMPFGEEQKMKMIEDCGEIEFRMVEGSDEYVQLESLLARFYHGK